MEIKELFEMIGRLYFDIYKSQEQMMQQKNIIQNLQQELSKLRGKDGPGETPQSGVPIAIGWDICGSWRDYLLCGKPDAGDSPIGESTISENFAQKSVYQMDSR